DLDKFKGVASMTTELGLTGAAIEIVVRRAIEITHEEHMDQAGNNALPVIKARHLYAALHDFKPNFKRIEYDFQSLLALRACNFHSVIPTLPMSGVYASIQNPDTHRVDPDNLEKAIQEIIRLRAATG
ncbi:MAG TPA: hypothetical protein VHD63_12550, partial [Ktedonobacteraceae bacterium]|nr:hypothetical protein [Ktedonobacteraceae bacterium]